VSSDSFTHLHVHTEFSMLDGAARLDEMVAKAVADGQPAIGMTDHGNMYGTLEFYKECRKQGIKPIIGTEAYMAHDHRSERPTRRGRVDESGGDTEGGKKLYYHLRKPYLMTRPGFGTGSFKAPCRIRRLRCRRRRHRAAHRQ
jgi:DNA polymerase-3 subunit alpha